MFLVLSVDLSIGGSLSHDALGQAGEVSFRWEGPGARMHPPSSPGHREHPPPPPTSPPRAPDHPHLEGGGTGTAGRGRYAFYWKTFLFQRLYHTCLWHFICVPNKKINTSMCELLLSLGCSTLAAMLQLRYRYLENTKKWCFVDLLWPHRIFLIEINCWEYKTYTHILTASVYVKFL